MFKFVLNSDPSVCCSHARLQNSLLSIKYPAEPVVWIGDLPDGVGPTVTFGELVGADDISAMNMAKSLGLSPTEEEDHLTVLNQMMRHLGVSCRRPTFLFSTVREMTINFVPRSPTKAYPLARESFWCQQKQTSDHVY